MPKEHGAYAQALLPLITGLALGRPSAAALLLALAVVLAFLAHEPALVALGWRGARARARGAATVRRRAAGLLAGAVVAGVLALVIAAGAVRLAALPPLGAAGVYGALVLRSRARSLGRDLLVAAAFAVMTLPVGLAAGGATWAAATGAGVWLATFGLQTFAVKGTIAAGKKGAPSGALTRATLVLSVGVLAGAGVLAATTARPGLAALAVVPAALHALVLAARPVAPRHLRRVGWSLAAVDTLVLVVLVALTTG